MSLRIDDSHPLFPSQKYNNKGQQENIHDWYLTVQGVMFYVEQADLATFNVHFISALLILSQVPEGSVGPIALSSNTRSSLAAHNSLCGSLALVMLKVCDLLAISFSTHNWKARSKPTLCPLFINMSS